MAVPTLRMHGMRYYYGIRTSIHIYTAPARICTPLIVSRSLANKPYVTEGCQAQGSSLIIHEYVRRRRRLTVLLYRCKGLENSSQVLLNKNKFVAEVSGMQIVGLITAFFNVFLVLVMQYAINRLLIIYDTSIYYAPLPAAP